MRGRCKEQPKPLTGRSLWRPGVTYQHRCRKVLCAGEADQRVWRVGKRDWPTADAAMDYIEGRYA